jgi:copper(I)-binding protein
MAAGPAPAVTGAFARATAPGQDTGGVFLTITSPADDTLVGASSGASRDVSMHVMTMAGNVMEMRALASVPLPAHVPVAFTPGDRHLMLEGLRHPLAKGTSVPVTLQFAHAAPLSIEVPVAGPGASAP